MVSEYPSKLVRVVWKKIQGSFKFCNSFCPIIINVLLQKQFFFSSEKEIQYTSFFTVYHNNDICWSRSNINIKSYGVGRKTIFFHGNYFRRIIYLHSFREKHDDANLSPKFIKMLLLILKHKWIWELDNYSTEQTTHDIFRQHKCEIKKKKNIFCKC